MSTLSNISNFILPNFIYIIPNCIIGITVIGTIIGLIFLAIISVLNTED